MPCRPQKQNTIHLNHNQALDLEIKLNRTVYGKIWRNLGKMLYEWRIDPNFYLISVPKQYNITNEQFQWISSNIDYSKRLPQGQYKLIMM